MELPEGTFLPCFASASSAPVPAPTCRPSSTPSRPAPWRPEISVVLSDNPEAFILQRAAEAGLSTGLIDCRGFRSKFPEEAQREAVDDLHDAAKVDLVCLAGFMRLLRAPFLEAFPGRIINIHPSLLPKFPGLEAWAQAVEAGARESGCTVHYVDAGVDSGPIIAQASVPVLPDDTPATLHARIQEQEHRIYPEAIAKVAASL